MQMKRMYCRKCHHSEDHIKVGRESMGENMGGLVRGIAAITTFGLTEFMTDHTYWKCTECGNITKAS